jgi:hypothetical protein
MTTAWWGWSMVRAQVTAWSERRSQVGAVLVVIMEVSSRGRCWVVGVSRADHTDTSLYVPYIWHLINVWDAIDERSIYTSITLSVY